MADEDNPREIDERSFPNIPVKILTSETIGKIAMELCKMGTLRGWRHVAGELGYSASYIDGHFENYPGCFPAVKMLNNWRILHGGMLQELVKVFKDLELFSCIEELQEEVNNWRTFIGSQDDSSSSSGSHSNRRDESDHPDLSEKRSFDYETFQQENEHERQKEFQVNVMAENYNKRELLNSTADQNHKNHFDITCISESELDNEEKRSSEQVCLDKPRCSPANISESILQEDKENVDNKQGNSTDGIVSFTSWPEFNRSMSEPSPRNNINNQVRIRRSISEDNSKKSRKNKSKKAKKGGSLLKIFKFVRRRREQGKNDEIAEINDLQEEQCIEVTLAPTKESQENENGLVQCPVNSSSEESLPDKVYATANTSDLDYEANKFKSIYIICNPGEKKVFEKAFKMYIRFLEKGYQCNLFSLNLNEEVEEGIFRYPMQQMINADNVFLCVSKELQKIFEGSSKTVRHRDDNSRSLRLVSDLMMSFLARHSCNKGGKIMPILLASDSNDYVPLFLGQYIRCQWPNQEAKMEKMIHGLPEMTIPVSNHVILASQKTIGLVR